eukprot:4242203-Pyramimonas_sp.AAC.1
MPRRRWRSCTNPSAWPPPAGQGRPRKRPRKRRNPSAQECRAPPRRRSHPTTRASAAAPWPSRTSSLAELPETP